MAASVIISVIAHEIWFERRGNQGREGVMDNLTRVFVKSVHADQ